MTFPHDFTGVSSERKYFLLPDGKYNLRIVSAVEGTTKSGDNKVTVDYEVFDGEHAGRPIKMHTVTFFPSSSPNSGITKGYLEALGVPADGSVEVDPLSWIGKIVVGAIGKKAYEGKEYNTVKWVEKYVIDYTKGNTSPQASKVADDDVPF